MMPPTRETQPRPAQPQQRATTSVMLVALLAWIAPDVLQAQPEAAPTTALDASYVQSLEYRMIGPFRASRTVGAVGIPSQPNVFFIGVNNGGVWKSDDYGRTWRPIFDDAPTGSVGDIAVSPSDPSILYVGSGEGLHRPDLSVGDGIFKSSDGGETWQHMGLEDVQQVGRLIVHPSDPDVVFVAGLGHPYGPNEERGVFRTRDGGESWEKVLYIDHNTGAIQVEFDPNDPSVVYADMWEHREGPWENASFSGRNSGLFKSIDGGDTWRRLETGLPDADDGLGRIGIGIAPSDSSRIYATVQATVGEGVYRSDDGGESWRRVSTDSRVYGRGGDFAEIRVHPLAPDTVFAGNVASYRSDDGGQNWTSIKGAPGGDDYHRIWINPEQPDIMLFATDQGATVTVNGGRTWSSWYNQPTAQLYHVATDNRFPYWVYGGQQESGAIGIASRGNGGQISLRDWIGIGADEYAYVAPDPLNPDIIYGGRVTRFDRRTGQSQNVAPEALRSGDYRILRTMPLLFHPAEPSTLLFATNVLWKTTNGAQSWQIISPDLSREQPEVPASIGDFATADLDTMPRRGVIYALAPSPLDPLTIWAGTDDGLIHVTRDGGTTWQDKTPPELQAWDKVAAIDAGRFDSETAYVAVNAIRRDDQSPYVYRTHDGGESWQLIVTGLAASGPVNVVREDPTTSGLLFAGTERQVYFSSNDGDHWQSLRLNMPATSIRDLVVHDNDLVVGSHGRSIWILDDLSPLRQTADALAQSEPFLFQPAIATRVRDNMFSDTPFPPEEPTGENPPDGAVLDYLLASKVGQVDLEILTIDGEAIRRYSSSRAPEQVDPVTLPHPTYWIKRESVPGTSPGHHRFVWDLRYEPPRGSQRQFSIAAVHGRTPSGPRGPLVAPGRYLVRLTADGVVLERSLEVRLDPRVEISAQALAQQTQGSMRAYRGYLALQEIREQIDARLGTGEATPAATDESAQALNSLRGEGQPGEADILYGSIRDQDSATETIVGLQEKFLYVLNLFQSADVRPTDQAMAALERLEAVLADLEKRFQALP